MKQKKSKPRKHPANVLKNKVFCGCCGGHMGIPDAGAKTPKYMCRRSVQYERGCTTGYVPKAAVYDKVFQSVKDMVRLFMDEETVIRKCMEKADRKSADRYGNELVEKQRTLNAFEQKKVALYEDFRNGLINEDEYLVLNGRYTDGMAAVSEAARELSELADREKKLVAVVSDIREKAAAFKGRRKLSQEMVDALIDRVVVYSEDCVEVVFQFEDELKLLLGEKVGDEQEEVDVA